MFVYVDVCSRRFNVYHRDVCGCTCIINASAHLAVAVQSLQRHVIARAALARCNDVTLLTLLSHLLPPSRFADDTERRDNG